MTITSEGIFVSDDEIPEDVISSFKRHKSLGHELIESLSEDDIASSTLFVDDASGREWTGAQLKQKILNVASALIDLYDFKRGTCVLISYDHSDHTIILALGVIFAGGVVACAYSKDPYAELLYLSKKVDPKFLFCHKNNMGWAKQLSFDLEHEVTGIAMDETLGPVSEPHFKNLLDYVYERAESKNLIPVACEHVGKDLAFIIMSSGTTGQPKAIPVTHAMILRDGFVTSKRHGLSMSLTSSLDYVSGRLIALGAINYGYRAIILRSSEPNVLLPAIEKYKINIVYLGAASFYNLITCKYLDDYDISSVAVVFPMGAKITYINELEDFLRVHTHIKTLVQGFGTSESAGVALRRMTPDDYLADSANCGPLLCGVQAKIVDSVTGKLLGLNEKGLIHVKSPRLFPGYYDVSRNLKNGYDQNGNSHSSSFIRDSTTFDEDGFYNTGDIAYFNDREELYILGRQKEVLCCRGAKKVLPDEIEVLMLEHPAALKVCVIGIPNRVELTLHCPRAFVVPKPICYEEDVEMPLTQPSGFTPEEPLEFKGTNNLCSLLTERRHLLTKDMMEFLNGLIGWEKQLTGGLVLIDEIPTLRETGKMNKGYLRSLTLDQIEIYGDRSG